MYRSLYAFRSTEPNSLHFSAGESFLILESTNKHWWLGSRCSSGETGYIPASYIEKVQVKSAQMARLCSYVYRHCISVASTEAMKGDRRRRSIRYVPAAQVTLKAMNTKGSNALSEKPINYCWWLSACSFSDRTREDGVQENDGMWLGRYHTAVCYPQQS